MATAAIVAKKKARERTAEAAANLLTNAALDPVGKIAEVKYCAVRVSAA